MMQQQPQELSHHQHHYENHHHQHDDDRNALNSTMDYSLSDDNHFEEEEEQQHYNNNPNSDSQELSSPSDSGNQSSSWAGTGTSTPSSTTTNTSTSSTRQQQNIFRTASPIPMDDGHNQVQGTTSKQQGGNAKKKKKKKKKKRSKKQRRHSFTTEQQHEQQYYELSAATKRRVLYGEQQPQSIFDEDTHVVWDVPPPKPWFAQLWQMKFCINLFCPPVVGGETTSSIGALSAGDSIPPLQRSPSRATSKSSTQASIGSPQFQQEKQKNIHEKKKKRRIPRMMPSQHHHPAQQHNSYHAQFQQQQLLPPQPHHAPYPHSRQHHQMMHMQQHPPPPPPSHHYHPQQYNHHPNFVYNTTPQPPQHHHHHHSNSSDMQNYPPKQLPMYHYPSPPMTRSHNNNQQNRQQPQIMFNFQMPQQGGVPLQQRVLSLNTSNTQTETSLANSNYNKNNNHDTPRRHCGHQGHGHPSPTRSAGDSLHSTPHSSSSSIVYDYQQHLPAPTSLSSSSTVPLHHHHPQQIAGQPQTLPLELGNNTTAPKNTNTSAPSNLSSVLQEQQEETAPTSLVASSSTTGRPPLPLDTTVGTTSAVSTTTTPTALATIPTPTSASTSGSLRRPNTMIQRCRSESSQTSTGSRHRRMSAAGSFSQRSLDQILNFTDLDLEVDSVDEDLSTSVNTATVPQQQQRQGSSTRRNTSTNNNRGRSQTTDTKNRLQPNFVRSESISKRLPEVQLNVDDGYISPLENDDYSFQNGVAVGPSSKESSPTKINGEGGDQEVDDINNVSPSKQTQMTLHQQRRYLKPKTQPGEYGLCISSSGSASGSPTREGAKSTTNITASNKTTDDLFIDDNENDQTQQPQGADAFKYLPKCQILEDPSKDILISGWVAFSIGEVAFSEETCLGTTGKGNSAVDEGGGNKGHQGIQQCHLGYLIITSSKSSLVFLQPQLKNDTSNNVTKQEVELSRTMTVDTHLISNRHGYAFVLKYQKFDLEEGNFISQTICTILPVSLSDHFFQDQSNLTLVSPPKIQEYQCSMFAPFLIWANEDEDEDHENATHKKDGDLVTPAVPMVVNPSSSVRAVQRHPYYHAQQNQQQQQNAGDFETEESSSLWIGQQYAPDAQTDAVTHIRFVVDTMVRECST